MEKINNQYLARVKLFKPAFYIKYRYYIKHKKYTIKKE